MQIATWNVNSVRSRLDHILTWLDGQPHLDALCLQETKVEDGSFPLAAFRDRGYQIEISGQKSYNGVAIVTRTPLEQVSKGFGPVLGETVAESWDAQKRVISGILDGVRIVNFYVPNGSALDSDKYPYKLGWLTTARDYLGALLAETPDLCVCGDFNIALENRDIWTDRDRDRHIMASPPEREALRSLMDLGLQDTFRKFTQDGGHFSWWDYRSGGFARNRGWRIDHLYVTANLYDRAIACTIDPTPRGWDKPSDHAPVLLEWK